MKKILALLLAVLLFSGVFGFHASAAEAQATQYTITYNKNCTDTVTNLPNPTYKDAGLDTNVSPMAPVRTGYTFKGWIANGPTGDAAYQPGQVYAADANITLYAKWEAVTYTVTYAPNATGVTNMPSPATKEHGKDLTLSANVPVRTGYSFVGWNRNNTATTAEFAPGATFTIDQNTTLYAVWQAIPSKTVTYIANKPASAPVGAVVVNMPADQTKYQGQELILSAAAPKLVGYQFKGWGTNREGPAVYQPGDKYTSEADITLYALWEYVGTPTRPGLVAPIVWLLYIVTFGWIWWWFVPAFTPPWLYA